MNNEWVATLGAGSIVGELQLLGVSDRRTASVTTTRISHIFEIKASVCLYVGIHPWLRES